MGRPKGTGYGRYGLPGQVAGDREYRLHYEYCKQLGRRISWTNYVASVGVPGARLVNKYGPPGAKACEPKARAHRAYCYYFKTEFTWGEYQERVNLRTKTNRYGRPGEREENEAREHRRFCKRRGRYYPWDEYRASVRPLRAKVPRTPNVQCKTVLLRPATEIIAKIQAMALTAMVSCA